MSLSEQQLEANRANALRSTGPVTLIGKATASSNATRHGILSERLFLEDEDPAEFQPLMDDLNATLRPSGTLELALVEKIAVNMWRQRRLVQAETAALALQRAPAKIASGVSSEVGLGYSGKLTEKDLEPFDQDQAVWCRGVLDEAAKLERIDPKTLPTAAPLIYAQLASDAESDGDDIETHLKDYENGLSGYVDRLTGWCREELERAEKRPHVLAVAEQVRAKRLVLPKDALELFSRYQTTLDNQLYKALKALREAQEWRLKTIDGSAQSDPSESCEAA